MDSNGANAAVGIVGLLFMLVIGLGAYLFFAYCLKLIAEKTGHEEDAGLWWIPIVNLLIPIRIAGKESWWIILFFVPLVNIVVSIIVWMAVAEARGKESWWGIIAGLSFTAFIGIPYLAFSDGGSSVAFDAD